MLRIGKKRWEEKVEKRQQSKVCVTPRCRGVQGKARKTKDICQVKIAGLEFSGSIPLACSDLLFTFPKFVLNQVNF